MDVHFPPKKFTNLSPFWAGLQATNLSPGPKKGVPVVKVGWVVNVVITVTIVKVFNVVKVINVVKAL